MIIIYLCLYISFYFFFILKRGGGEGWKLRSTHSSLPPVSGVPSAMHLKSLCYFAVVSRVESASISFDRVWSNFTEFLPSFTEFYRVLPSFTELLWDNGLIEVITNDIKVIFVVVLVESCSCDDDFSVFIFTWQEKWRFFLLFGWWFLFDLIWFDFCYRGRYRARSFGWLGGILRVCSSARFSFVFFFFASWMENISGPSTQAKKKPKRKRERKEREERKSRRKEDGKKTATIPQRETQRG